jgi:predicted secreted protein
MIAHVLGIVQRLRGVELARGLGQWEAKIAVIYAALQPQDRRIYTLVNKFCNGRLCNLHALQTSLYWFQNSNKSKTPNERF